MPDNLEVHLKFVGDVWLTHDAYENPNGPGERTALEMIADEALSYAVSTLNQYGWRVERSTVKTGVIHDG